jgi:hypothetical protein
MVSYRLQVQNIAKPLVAFHRFLNNNMFLTHSIPEWSVFVYRGAYKMLAYGTHVLTSYSTQTSIVWYPGQNKV